MLGDIYLGKITKWNDKAIADLNPGVTLPDADIGVVRRADGSGTTAIFTNYLAKVNAEWKQKVGEGNTVQWPVGLGGKGNEGVAAFVQRLPGSIGYVESAYAKQNKLAARADAERRRAITSSRTKRPFRRRRRAGAPTATTCIRPTAPAPTPGRSPAQRTSSCTRIRKSPSRRPRC